MRKYFSTDKENSPGVNVDYPVAAGGLGMTPISLKAHNIIKTNKIPNQISRVGISLSYNINLQTSDGSSVTYNSANNLPEGLSMDLSGLITGTPTVINSYNPIINASPKNGAGKDFPFNWTIYNINPIISPIANQLNERDLPIDGLQIVATSDLPLYYNISELPSGLSLNANSGLITGTPTVAGNYSSIVAGAYDYYGGSAQVTFDWDIFQISLPTKWWVNQIGLINNNNTDYRLKFGDSISKIISSTANGEDIIIMSSVADYTDNYIPDRFDMVSQNINGNTNWIKTFTGVPHAPTSVAVEQGSNTLFAFGNCLVKATSNLESIHWAKEIQSSTPSYYYSISPILNSKFDSNGNIYICARHEYDYAIRRVLVAKHDISGEPVWQKSFGIAGDYWSGEFSKHQLDSPLLEVFGDNIYVSFIANNYRWPDYDNNPDSLLFIVSLNTSDGSENWRKQISVNGSNKIVLSSLNVDGTGNTYLTFGPRFYTENNSRAPYRIIPTNNLQIVKLSQIGDIVYNTEIDLASSSKFLTCGVSTAVEPSGEVYISGVISEEAYTTSKGKLLLFKLNSEGVVEYQRRISQTQSVNNASIFGGAYNDIGFGITQGSIYPKNYDFFDPSIFIRNGTMKVVNVDTLLVTSEGYQNTFNTLYANYADSSKYICYNGDDSSFSANIGDTRIVVGNAIYSTQSIDGNLVFTSNSSKVSSSELVSKLQRLDLVPNTQLLINTYSISTAFTDSSGNNTITNNNSVSYNSSSHFLEFNGSNYLTVDGGVSFNSGPFTFEQWITPKDFWSSNATSEYTNKFPYLKYYSNLSRSFLHNYQLFNNLETTYYDDPTLDAVQLNVNFGGDPNAWSNTDPVGYWTSNPISHYSLGLSYNPTDLQYPYQGAGAIMVNYGAGEHPPFPSNTWYYDTWTWNYSFLINDPDLKLKYYDENQWSTTPNSGLKIYPQVSTVMGRDGEISAKYYNTPVSFEMWFSQNEQRKNKEINYSGYTNFGDFQSGCPDFHERNYAPLTGHFRRYLSGVVKNGVNLATANTSDIMFGLLIVGDETGGTGYICVNGNVVSSGAVSGKINYIEAYVDTAGEGYIDINNPTMYQSYDIADLYFESATEWQSIYSICANTGWFLDSSVDCFNTYDVKYAWYIDYDNADNQNLEFYGDPPVMYTHPGWRDSRAILSGDNDQSLQIAVEANSVYVGTSDTMFTYVPDLRHTHEFNYSNIAIPDLNGNSPQFGLNPNTLYHLAVVRDEQGRLATFVNGQQANGGYKIDYSSNNLYLDPVTTTFAIPANGEIINLTSNNWIMDSGETCNISYTGSAYINTSSNLNMFTLDSLDVYTTNTNSNTANVQINTSNIESKFIFSPSP